MGQVIKFVIGGLMILGLPSIASASLIGDTIDIEWWFPDTSTVFASDSHLVSELVEVNCPNDSTANSNICAGFVSWPASIDIGAETIRYQQIGSPGFTTAGFNGWVFSDLDWGVAGEIIGVSLDTNIDGLDLNRVSYTADSVSINLQGLGGDLRREFAELTLDVRHVPDPATLALFGIGLAGLGFARRKKKTSVH